MITTLRLERIGVVDPSYFFPFVGGREDGAPGVTTALERTLNLLESPFSSRLSYWNQVYSKPEFDVMILQQRSPVLKVRIFPLH